jgi:cobaltochelatase CobT
MRENLDAATEMRLRSDAISRAERAEQVPMAAALSLLLREKLTGQPVPEVAKRGVEMCAPSSRRAGGDLAALAGRIEDQRAFQAWRLTCCAIWT